MMHFLSVKSDGYGRFSQRGKLEWSQVVCFADTTLRSVGNFRLPKLFPAILPNRKNPA